MQRDEGVRDAAAWARCQNAIQSERSQLHNDPVFLSDHQVILIGHVQNMQIYRWQWKQNEQLWRQLWGRQSHIVITVAQPCTYATSS